MHLLLPHAQCSICIDCPEQPTANYLKIHALSDAHAAAVEYRAAGNIPVRIIDWPVLPKDPISVRSLA